LWAVSIAGAQMGLATGNSVYVFWVVIHFPFGHLEVITWT
jgi:hypothetical protein